jgi:precorrin-6B C5,15-methyltransferase / cobalt-precorrin-6B C5,C15-methyltransferase
VGDRPGSLRPGRLAIVGVQGGRWFGPEAEAAVRAATVVVGARRHLAALGPALARSVEPLGRPLAAALDAWDARLTGGDRVCVLASGDPGFFGLTRLAVARFGADRVEVHPAPSAVALAFARLGLAWDDAAVVSAHGRDLEAACDAVAGHPKVAVLVSPDQPPEAVGRRLVATGCPPRAVSVLSRLGEPAEARWSGDLAGLASGRFDPVSVVVLCAESRAGGTGDPGGGGDPGPPNRVWGRPDAEFAHRDGMITKAEVRAVALGKLGLPRSGVLWDVGAGSGSVAIECAGLAPGLQVFAVERRADDAARIRSNAAGTTVTVVEGEAPAAFAGLPDPDRVFVGGGGLAALRAARARLRPGGTVVATYTALDRAAEAARLLGQLVQISVARGTPIGVDGALRLEAENPVFICWGPR